MANLDRFAQGLPDPQSKPPVVVAHCPVCDDEIWLGSSVYTDNTGEWFCSIDCFYEFHGLRLTMAGE